MALTQDQITICRKQADLHGLPQAFVLGIVEKESNGNVFWSVEGRKLPAIRPEGHYFYKFLSGVERTKAVSQDLASPKSGGVHVPAKFTAVYAMFARMVSINKEAAYQSISMGIGQVMGSHYKLLGFKSAEEMFKHACTGLEGQLDLMLRFISMPANSNMLKAARLLDYKTFSKLYNGPGYRRNNYDVLLKRHTEKWQGKVDQTPAVNPVRIEIEKLGFPSVENFQAHYGLEPDGKVGPLTNAAVNEVKASINKHEAAPVNGAILTAGAGGIIAWATDGLKNLASLLDPYKEALGGFQHFTTIGPDFVRTLALCAIAAAIGFGVHYYITERRNRKLIASE